jgi:tartrate-resistant acid phosphatase type 5
MGVESGGGGDGAAAASSTVSRVGGLRDGMVRGAVSSVASTVSRGLRGVISSSTGAHSQLQDVDVDRSGRHDDDDDDKNKLVGGATAISVSGASSPSSSSSSSSSPFPSPAAWRTAICGVGDKRRAGLMAAGVSVTVVLLLAGLATRGLDNPLLARNDPTFGGAVVEGSSVRFLAVGDWGRKGIENQPEVAASMGAWAEVLRPSFVVSVGDNFYEGGITPGAGLSDPQFRSSFLDVFTHPALVHLPFYAIYGNHDYRGDMHAQIAFTGAPSGGRWEMKDLNQSFVVPIPAGRTPSGPAPATCLGLVLSDTSPFITYYRDPEHWESWPQFGPNILGAHPDAQLAWVKREVARVSAQCAAVIVVGHHPLFSAGEHGDSQDMIDAFKGTLDSEGVDVYLAGHDHTLVLLRSGAVDYVISGGGSRVRDNSHATPETVWFADATPGFTIHSANATHVATAFVNGRTGDVMHVSLKALRRKGGKR